LSLGDIAATDYTMSVCKRQRFPAGACESSWKFVFRIHPYCGTINIFNKPALVRRLRLSQEVGNGYFIIDLEYKMVRTIHAASARLGGEGRYVVFSILLIWQRKTEYSIERS